MLDEQFYVLQEESEQAWRCQQAFSGKLKPCLVNLISKDTHLVISIFVQNVADLLVALL